LRYLVMSGIKIAKSYAEVQAEKNLVEREYYTNVRPEWEAFGF
jgi:hypothetical protein